MSDKYKTCWACKWFAFEDGEPDYSDVTPGGPFSIRCNKFVVQRGGRKLTRYDESDPDQQTFRKCINMAKTCPDFKDRE